MPVWPMLGRSAELRQVSAALTAAGAGGAVIAGPAGVGKTRLAREALRDYPAGTVRWVVGTAAARSIPFGALAPLLPRPAGGDPVDQLALLQSAAAALAAPANAGSRLILAIDDAHLLDDASATLVQQLALAGTATILATTRAGELASDAVNALWKDVGYPRIDLLPLGRDTLEELVRAALGGSVDRFTLARLWHITGGNPLFLFELVESARDQGSLAQRFGVWSWPGPLVPGARLVELVRSRFRAAGDSVQLAVELLALGEPLDAGSLDRLLPAGALAAAERAGLVSIDLDGGARRARLAHPAYGEVARAAMTNLDLQARQRSLAGMLAEPYHPVDVMRVAALRLAADGTAEPDLLTRAARYASQSLDFGLAERLARGAVTAGAGFAGALEVALALAGQRRADEADAAFAEAEHRATTDDERAAASFHRAQHLVGLDRPDAAESIRGTAFTAVTTPRARNHLRYLEGCLLALAGEVGTALDILAEIRDSPDTTPQTRMFTTSTEVLALAVAGRTREAIRTAESGWRAWRQRYDGAGGRWLAMADNEILALRLGGQLADAIARAEAYRADGESTLNPTHTAIGCAWLGQLAIATGRPATARRWLTESIAPLSRYDPCHLLYRVHLGLAEAWALSGDAQPAASHLAAARAIPHTAVAVLEPTDRLAEAWVAAAAGELQRAAHTAIRAADVARARGQYGLEGLALHTGLRFDPTTAAASRLPALAERADNPLLAAFAAHATALAGRSGAGLDLAAEQLSGLGATLLAAEVAGQAAAAWAAAGHRAKSLAASARADRALASCEDACTPVIARRATATAGLSPREHEVAGLASRGLRNQHIAGRLGVSVRTVESHLLRAYAKLGISSRAELAEVLRVD